MTGRCHCIYKSPQDVDDDSLDNDTVSHFNYNDEEADVDSLDGGDNNIKVLTSARQLHAKFEPIRSIKPNSATRIRRILYVICHTSYITHRCVIHNTLYVIHYS